MTRLLRWIVPDMPWGWGLREAMWQELSLMTAYFRVSGRWVGDTQVWNAGFRVVA